MDSLLDFSTPPEAWNARLMECRPTHRMKPKTRREKFLKLLGVNIDWK